MKETSRRRVKFVAAGALIGFCAAAFAAHPVASAERSLGFPRQGTYTASVVGTGFYEVTEVTDGVGAAIYRYEVEVVNSSGRGFLHGMTGYCIGLGVYGERVNHESGYCAFIESEEDRFFEHYEHYGGTRGSGIAIGGSGKYAGLEASYEYEFKDVDTQPGAKFESTSTRTGRYRFP